MPKKSKEERQAYQKEYYQRNREKALEQAKVSYERKKKQLTPEQKLKHAEHQREYYQDNKEKILTRNRTAQKEWYQDNKGRVLQERKAWRQKMLGSLEYRFKRAIQTSKQRGISFTLTFEQYKEVVEKPCYYCNFELCCQVKEGSGLDRIDSRNGYEISNVVSCGHRCNSIKNDDLTIEEARAAIQAILKVRHEKLRRTKAGERDQNSGVSS